MNVLVAAGEQVIGDLDKEGRPSLRRLVVSRDLMDGSCSLFNTPH